MIDQHLTTTGAARLAGRSAETIREWARRGILTPVMAPSGIRIYRREDVEPVASEMDARRRARRASDGDSAA
jgi:DNA-binding transcriptional MerR regulator